jgi:DNA adenine methylase
MIQQMTLFGDPVRIIQPFRLQLLKWIGNKQRFAHEIVYYFPYEFNRYFEPFLGSGGVLGTLLPQHGFGSDTFGPLIEIWTTLRRNPEQLKMWYRERFEIMMKGDRIEGYEKIKASYNSAPNGADLLFLCRSCYGGVVRFRKDDGYMSTPCGIHAPIHPNSFSKRVDIWNSRLRGTEFHHLDFEEAMDRAKHGDLVYCDPPYSDTQAILYGAQSFSLLRLFKTIEKCKARGVYVALSIDGTKKSGDRLCEIQIPDGSSREKF